MNDNDPEFLVGFISSYTDPNVIKFLAMGREFLAKNGQVTCEIGITREGRDSFPAKPISELTTADF